MRLRVGFGYDVHPLKEGESFWLGGIEIPHNKGTVAHSDGDVLIHAICDAMLGASGLRDIGTQFPDSDSKYKNIDSKILLQETADKIRNLGYWIENIDSTICLQAPKIKDYVVEMQKTLSHCLNIFPDMISIKATTNEKLGFVGREEGVVAYAVILIAKYQ